MPVQNTDQAITDRIARVTGQGLTESWWRLARNKSVTIRGRWLELDLNYGGVIRKPTTENGLNERLRSEVQE